MSKLPYFRWYPADAETDTNFCAMDDADIGFYIRCLNHAWINGGIPADPKERARVLKTRLDTANTRWKRVGKCFVTSPTMPDSLINLRQETERGLASRKSLKAAESVKHRYERTTNVPIRAYDSDSDSGFASFKGESEGENSTEVAGPPWKRDGAFSRFAADYLATGGAFIDLDFAEAFDVCWSKLDLGQKLERTAALNRHSEEYASDPRFVPRPLKFLQSEWARPVKPMAARIPNRNDVRRQELDAGFKILEKIRGRA